jgi:HEAT repeat protein
MNLQPHQITMKKLILLTLILGMWSTSLSLRAENNVETQCIAILQSDRTPAEKDAACVQLKRAATAKSVPALAPLLAHEGLSHPACHVLETLPGTEAATALIQALGQTSGLTRIGIINTLGARRKLAQTAGFNTNADQSGTAALTTLLSDADPATVLAAARALSLVPSHWNAQSNRDKAWNIYEFLYKNSTTSHIQAAAYRGMILTSNDRTKLMLDALSGTSSPAQMAALQWIPTISVPGVAELLPKLSPTVQTALITGLGQRGDVTTAPAIAALAASSSDPAVRQAACEALGSIGGNAEIPILVQIAATSRGEEQKAARNALLTLHQGNPTDTMLELLSKSQPAIQVELSRALGQRANPSALPKLLELARNTHHTSRSAALQAIALLAEAPQLPELVSLVTTATDETARNEAVECVNYVCEHIQSRHASVPVEPILQGLNASTESRVALLRVCAGLNDTRVREAIRDSLLDTNTQIRNAAMRALCETRDPELLPDMIHLAQATSEAEFRTLAVRGITRLTTQEEGVSWTISQKIASLQAILLTATTPELKQIILSGLGEIVDVKALDLILPLLSDDTVKAEAAGATIKVSGAIATLHPKAAAQALQIAIKVTVNPVTREEAVRILKQIEDMTAYMTQWQVSGPYMQEGLNYAALFDVAFDPEKPEPNNASWQTLPPATDPNRPWLMNILKVHGGEQRVAYVRTWIHADSEQPAVLELGSDDGLKIWFNDALILTNNASRGLTPGSDKVNITLKSGWNKVLLKITQNNAGWEFCVKCVKLDGTPIPGLFSSAELPK